MNLINYDTEDFYYITSETVSDDNLVLNKSYHKKKTFC